MFDPINKTAPYSADDLLASAKCCDSLQEAIADCQIVIGASARSRTIAVPEESPRICAERLACFNQYDPDV
jgi:tRNA C32,U32 (ribose-2'-O)-methylase TrmJ